MWENLTGNQQSVEEVLEDSDEDGDFIEYDIRIKLDPIDFVISQESII